MTYKAIADYGIIGDGLTTALVGDDGAVEWMCLPCMDSPSVFAAILDDEKGGAFTIQPDGEEWDSVQKYIPRTNILLTRFRTISGELEITDFIAGASAGTSDQQEGSYLFRKVVCTSGRINVRITCQPRFNYASETPEARSATAHIRQWWTGADSLSLFLSDTVDWDKEESACLEMSEDDCLWCGLTWGAFEQFPLSASSEFEDILKRTKDQWLDWIEAAETGKYPGYGSWQESLERCALVMKLLQFKPTGAIAAAGSCSLPTIVHGERNWDYRFSWIRDTSMTLAALYELGHTDEAMAYLDWLKDVGRQTGNEALSIMYKLQEPTPPDGEHELPYLKGHKQSYPVHIGQFNVGQNQHDIYGELLEMVFSISRIVGKIDPDYWPFVKRQVDHVADIWREKDHGIWELRTGPHHVTHSKLMCWVALDRGIKIAEHYGFPADLAFWKREREAVREDILENAYSPERKSFTQHYETDELDSSVLRIPLTGLLPADDERMTNTISAIEEELLFDGGVVRYVADDGLPGQEPGFLLCLFWYLRCLIRQGRLDEVEDYLRKVDGYANHLGLFGEQFNGRYNEITGNLPQGFSHIGYAMTVLEYLEACREKPQPPSLPWKSRVALLFHPVTLTPRTFDAEACPVKSPDKAVKQTMNILRAQFYDGHNQRIDYPLIRMSSYYNTFLASLGCLEEFDLTTLASDSERIAFWMNVFNVMVIHGVIELRICDSVKQVPLFFDRVQYKIGNHLFTLSDIEHGILRCNARPPRHLTRCFQKSDPRQAFCPTQIDPRVHFGLVCATRACPPVEAYDSDPDCLDEQLDQSARTFINSSTTVHPDQQRVYLSEIFKWYHTDFANDTADIIRFVSDYLYDERTAQWLKQNAGALDIRYNPYDWRLNEKVT